MLQEAQHISNPQEPIAVEVLQGPLLQEVRQQFSDWAYLTTRLWAGADHIEQQWTVGPIPNAENGLGREIISRIQTTLSTGKTNIQMHSRPCSMCKALLVVAHPAE